MANHHGKNAVNITAADPEVTALLSQVPGWQDDDEPEPDLSWLTDDELDRWGELIECASEEECEKIILAERRTAGKTSEPVSELEFHTIRELRARVAAEG